MSQQTRPIASPYIHHAAGIDGFDSLVELALNLRWSWNHATDEVWRLLDSKLWDITNNPWVVLQTASSDKIKEVLGDPAFRKRVDGLIDASREAAEAPAWFKKTTLTSPDLCRLFQHGVHVERSSADLLWRTRECSGRSDESGQRSWCSCGRHRAALSAGLFSAGDR